MNGVPRQGLLKAISWLVPAVQRQRFIAHWKVAAPPAGSVGFAQFTLLCRALFAALTLDRVRPIDPGAELERWATRRVWRTAALAAALLPWGFIFMLFGGFDLEPATLANGQQLFSVAALIGRILALLGAAFLVVGAAQIMFYRLGRTRVRLRLPTWAAVLLFVGVLVLLTAYTAVGYGVVALCAIGVLFGSLTAQRPPRHAVILRTGAQLRRGLLLVLLSIGVSAVGLLHVLRWNPQAKVPSLSLDQIYTQLYAAGERSGAMEMYIWAGCWPVCAALVAIGAACRWRVAPGTSRGWLIAGGLLIGAQVFFLWFASFAMSMGLADAFDTSGADAAPAGYFLTLCGTAALSVAGYLSWAPPPPRRSVSAGEPLAS